VTESLNDAAPIGRIYGVSSIGGGPWIGGIFAATVVGSYSAVVGLLLYESYALLSGEGFPALGFWEA
jgi:hypothetical protein